jgi:AraC-like DNA-binding protein
MAAMTLHAKNMIVRDSMASIAEPTVAAGLVFGLLHIASIKGADPESLAKRAGIDPDMLKDQDNRVPLKNYVALMRAAKLACNDPAFALHYGESNELADISVVGLIVQGAETMHDAFIQLNRYGRLVIETNGPSPDRFQHLRADTNRLWLLDTRKNPNDFYELTESTWARFVCGPRRFDATRFVHEVHVTHADPGYRAEYERIFEVPVFFNSNKNALLIDESWTLRKIARSPRYVFGVLSDHADHLLASLERTKTFRAQVESLILPILHTGEIGMSQIAARMNMTRQTLLRRLKAEGTTFEKLVDELRHRLALDYLRAQKTSVYDAAYLVGFSDPAAFSRAVKRWTGLSPKAVRSQADGLKAAEALD